MKAHNLTTHRPFLMVILSLALLSASAIGLLDVGQAQAKCQPVRTSEARYYQLSYIWDYHTTLGGVYARIENDSPWVTSPPSTIGSNAAVFLDSGNNYVQFGWIERPGGIRNTFVQLNQPGWLNTWFNDPQPVGSYPYYAILYGNYPGAFTFQLDGNSWAPYNSGGLNPPATFTPTEANVQSETTNTASEIPHVGYFDAKVFVQNIGYWQEFGSVYQQAILAYPGLSYLGNSIPWAGHDGPYLPGGGQGAQFYTSDLACPNG